LQSLRGTEVDVGCISTDEIPHATVA